MRTRQKNRNWKSDNYGRRRDSFQVENSSITMNRFLRIGLPLILLAILVIVALFVLNAFEVTALMETEKRAGPTILNR